MSSCTCLFVSFRQAVAVKPSAGPSLCVRAEEWKIKAIDRSNEPREKQPSVMDRRQ